MIIDARILKLADEYGFILTDCYNESERYPLEGIDVELAVFSPVRNDADKNAFRIRLEDIGAHLCADTDEDVTIIL